MSTVAQIRAALAAAVSEIPDLNVHAVWPGQINPDAAVVRRLTTSFLVDFEGSTDSQYGISVYVSAADVGAGQERIDAYLSTSGARSVKAALEAASPTLGGVVEYFAVDGADEEGVVELAGVQYLSATVNVRVGSL